VTGVSLHYEHANRTPQIVAMDQLPGVVNYLIGTDQSAWQTGVPTYEGIRYIQLYPGIDLQVDGSEGQLKSTYLVAPGADPSQIQWSYRGGRDVTVTAQGTLEVEVPVSPPAGWRATQPLTITEQAPVAWQERDGQRVSVDVRYVVGPNRRVTFALGAHDRALPLCRSSAQGRRSSGAGCMPARPLPIRPAR
jgi:hypothetical protein